MKDKKRSLPIINDQIRASQLQVITEQGENVGIIPRNKALQLAEEANLDLVVLTENGPDDVPIAKIMDFGKVLYERKKKQAESKKHQKVIQVKEVKMRPKIGEHDFQTKIKRAVQFLNSGKRVKISLFFKGRENIQKVERGRELFERVERSFDEHELKNIVKEREASLGQSCFRIYYLK